MAESVTQRGRRERRAWAAGLLISLALHVVLLLLFRDGAVGPSTAAAGPRAGSPQAAAGGAGLRAVVVRPPQPIVVPPRPELVVEAEPVEVEPRLETPNFSERSLAFAGEGREEGSETGPGRPGGEGAGDAGDADEGLLRLLPPEAWHVLLPLGSPPEARGRDVTVHVFVTAAGTVDSVRLDPTTPSREYNQLLIRQAYQWRFEPARRGGRPVPVWFQYTVSIP